MIIRSIAAVFCGLVLISLIAEPIEYLFVSLSAGKTITEQDKYFQHRNQTALLVLKFLYNGIAAVVAGFLTAMLAGRRHVLHGHFLALTQSILFIWGMTMSEFAGTTPSWFWIPAVPMMYFCCLTGAVLYARRAHRKEEILNAR